MRDSTRRDEHGSARPDEHGSARRDEHGSARRDERGSAAIEAAALIPLVLGVLVVIAQVFAMAYTSQGVSQSARDAARAYSLGESPQAAAAASLPSGVRLVSVSTFGPNHGVTVTAEAPSIVVLTDRTVTRSVTMP